MKDGTLVLIGVAPYKLKEVRDDDSVYTRLIDGVDVALRDDEVLPYTEGNRTVFEGLLSSIIGIAVHSCYKLNVLSLNSKGGVHYPMGGLKMHILEGSVGAEGTGESMILSYSEIKGNLLTDFGNMYSLVNRINKEDLKIVLRSKYFLWEELLLVFEGGRHIANEIFPEANIRKIGESDLI